jgi:hypothetical protein
LVRAGCLPTIDEIFLKNYFTVAISTIFTSVPGGIMNRTIKYHVKVVALCSALVLAHAYAASAPRFSGKSQASFTTTDGEVSISFKESGLNPGTTVNYLAAGTVTASYGCFTVAGSMCTSQESIAGISSTPGALTSNSKGIVSGTLTINPPMSTLSCFSGQSPTLLSVSYSNFVLQDESNGVMAKVSPTSLSATYANCP